MRSKSNNGSNRAFRPPRSIRPWSSSLAFTGSYSSVRRKVRKLRGKTPKATCVLDFAPGEAAQVDFGTGPEITDVFTGDVIKTWIFVMTLCFSRHMYAEIVTDQKVATWLACHRRAFEFFNGVPAKADHRQPQVRHHPGLLSRTRRSSAPTASWPKATAFSYRRARQRTRKKRAGWSPG